MVSYLVLAKNTLWVLSMKKVFTVFATVLTAFAVGGCATKPTQQLLTENETREYKQRLDRIKKIEVFYSNDNSIAVFDSGGSGAAGMSGLLGPIGMLAALAVDASSKISAIDRAKDRSKELSDKVRSELPEANLSRDFAELIAEKLRGSGREVSLTALTTDRASNDLAKYPQITQISDDRGVVVIWNNPGFTSESSTAPYLTSAVIDYYCQDSDKRKLVDGQIKSQGDSVGRTFSGLKDEIKTVYPKLRLHYLKQSAALVNECFDVPIEKRTVDRLNAIYK